MIPGEDPGSLPRHSMWDSWWDLGRFDLKPSPWSQALSTCPWLSTRVNYNDWSLSNVTTASSELFAHKTLSTPEIPALLHRTVPISVKSTTLYPSSRQAAKSCRFHALPPEYNMMIFFPPLLYFLPTVGSTLLSDHCLCHSSLPGRPNFNSFPTWWTELGFKIDSFIILKIITQEICAFEHKQLQEEKKLISPTLSPLLRSLMLLGCCVSFHICFSNTYLNSAQIRTHIFSLVL